MRGWLLVLALVVGVVGTTLALSREAAGPEVTARVVRVVDGDTFVAELEGRTETVRLLNLDTPELRGPGGVPECLGPEATRVLQSLLPEGSEVELSFDQERLDRYGRTLAGVHVEDVFVNAEIARQGLGTAVLFEPNRRFHREVLQAEREARRSQRGLFDPNLTCR